MNRLMMRTLGLAVLLALTATAAWAGSGERQGTSGATELLIPVGARGSALGGTATSNVTGIEASFWNPAGLGSMEGTEALFTHTQYIADMSVNYAAIAVKAGGLGTLGFSAKVLSIGDIIVTTEQAPDGTGEIMSPTFGVFGVYVLLLPLLGYRVATFVFVLGCSFLLEPPRRAGLWLRGFGLAGVTALATHFVFEDYLAVLLPRGSWTGF